MAEDFTPVKHVRPRRMWNYAHRDLELTLEEHAHVADCPACQHLFRLCALAERPKQDPPEEQDNQGSTHSA